MRKENNIPVQKDFGLREHRCRECGKVFECSEGYVYKRKKKDHNFDYFCSYSCLRKYDKRKESHERTRNSLYDLCAE